MRILILGATGLSGTAITLAALRRGHAVVAVHRGRSDTLPELDDPRLLDLVHDRAQGHAALLANGPYDAIVDVSARVPAWVADAVRVLDVGSPWWVQLSSVSAYADQNVRGPRESDPVATFDDPVVELAACTDPHVEFSYDWYAPAKAAAERLLLEAVQRQSRATVLRPVLITGAHDWTWRTPRWLARVARGGTVLAPPADAPVQVIDAQDLAELVLQAIEERIPGVYNAAPARGSQTIGSLLAACVQVVRDAGIEPATVVHAPRELLAEHDVEPWSQLPAWIPPDMECDAMVTADTTLLEEVFGFEARPLTETLAPVLRWVQGVTDPPEDPLDPAREREVLAAC
ncbi:MAG: putative reductase [Thermoleophilia bacterium]|nr:putative reductase [Thermoleophilia bacterium]